MDTRILKQSSLSHTLQDWEELYQELLDKELQVAAVLADERSPFSTHGASGRLPPPQPQPQPAAHFTLYPPSHAMYLRTVQMQAAYGTDAKLAHNARTESTACSASHAPPSTSYNPLHPVLTHSYVELHSTRSSCSRTSLSAASPTPPPHPSLHHATSPPTAQPQQAPLQQLPGHIFDLDALAALLAPHSQPSLRTHTSTQSRPRSVSTGAFPLSQEQATDLLHTGRSPGKVRLFGPNELGGKDSATRRRSMLESPSSSNHSPEQLPTDPYLQLTDDSLSLLPTGPYDHPFHTDPWHAQHTHTAHSLHTDASHLHNHHHLASWGPHPASEVSSPYTPTVSHATPSQASYGASVSAPLQAWMPLPAQPHSEAWSRPQAAPSPASAWSHPQAPAHPSAALEWAGGLTQGPVEMPAAQRHQTALGHPHHTNLFLSPRRYRAHSVVDQQGHPWDGTWPADLTQSHDPSIQRHPHVWAQETTQPAPGAQHASLGGVHHAGEAHAAGQSQPRRRSAVQSPHTVLQSTQHGVHRSSASTLARLQGGVWHGASDAGGQQQRVRSQRATLRAVVRRSPKIKSPRRNVKGAEARIGRQHASGARAAEDHGVAPRLGSTHLLPRRHTHSYQIRAQVSASQDTSLKPTEPQGPTGKQAQSVIRDNQQSTALDDATATSLPLGTATLLGFIARRTWSPAGSSSASRADSPRIAASTDLQTEPMLPLDLHRSHSSQSHDTLAVLTGAACDGALSRSSLHCTSSTCHGHVVVPARAHIPTAVSISASSACRQQVESMGMVQLSCLTTGCTAQPQGSSIASQTLRLLSDDGDGSDGGASAGAVSQRTSPAASGGGALQPVASAHSTGVSAWGTLHTAPGTLDTVDCPSRQRTATNSSGGTLALTIRDILEGSADLGNPAAPAPTQHHQAAVSSAPTASAMSTPLSQGSQSAGGAQEDCLQGGDALALAVKAATAAARHYQALLDSIPAASAADTGSIELQHPASTELPGATAASDRMDSYVSSRHSMSQGGVHGCAQGSAVATLPFAQDLAEARGSDAGLRSEVSGDRGSLDSRAYREAEAVRQQSSPLLPPWPWGTQHSGQGRASTSGLPGLVHQESTDTVESSGSAGGTAMPAAVMSGTPPRPPGNRAAAVRPNAQQLPAAGRGQLHAGSAGLAARQHNSAGGAEDPGSQPEPRDAARARFGSADGVQPAPEPDVSDCDLFHEISLNVNAVAHTNASVPTMLSVPEGPCHTAAATDAPTTETDTPTATTDPAVWGGTCVGGVTLHGTEAMSSVGSIRTAAVMPSLAHPQATEAARATGAAGTTGVTATATPAEEDTSASAAATAVATDRADASTLSLPGPWATGASGDSQAVQEHAADVGSSPTALPRMQPFEDTMQSRSTAAVADHTAEVMGGAEGDAAAGRWDSWAPTITNSHSGSTQPVPAISSPSSGATTADTVGTGPGPHAHPVVLVEAADAQGAVDVVGAAGSLHRDGDVHPLSGMPSSGAGSQAAGPPIRGGSLNDDSCKPVVLSRNSSHSQLQASSPPATPPVGILVATQQPGTARVLASPGHTDSTGQAASGGQAAGLSPTAGPSRTALKQANGVIAEIRTIRSALPPGLMIHLATTLATDASTLAEADVPREQLQRLAALLVQLQQLLPAAGPAGKGGRVVLQLHTLHQHLRTWALPVLGPLGLIPDETVSTTSTAPTSVTASPATTISPRSPRTSHPPATARHHSPHDHHQDQRGAQPHPVQVASPTPAVEPSGSHMPSTSFSFSPARHGPAAGALPLLSEAGAADPTSPRTSSHASPRKAAPPAPTLAPPLPLLKAVSSDPPATLPHTRTTSLHTGSSTHKSDAPLQAALSVHGSVGAGTTHPAVRPGSPGGTSPPASVGVGHSMPPVLLSPGMTLAEMAAALNSHTLQAQQQQGRAVTTNQVMSPRTSARLLPFHQQKQKHTFPRAQGMAVKSAKSETEPSEAGVPTQDLGLGAIEEGSGGGSADGAATMAVGGGDQTRVPTLKSKKSLKARLKKMFSNHT